MMERLLKMGLIALLGLMLWGCASVPQPQGGPLSAQDTVQAPPYDAWGRVLKQHVDSQGRVNFAGVAKDRKDLDRFVAYVYTTGPNNRPELFPTPAHVMAYHLNAYNALAMHKVIETGIPTTLAGLRKVTFFAFGKVQFGGQAISLFDYENKVIRALNDARIHVALNCMSIGCPQLPQEVFEPERVNQQLDREARKFFNEERNVMISHNEKVVRVSEILKFYTSDFLAEAPSLNAYINQYRDDKVPLDYKVEFTPYDWTINRQP